MIHLLIGDEMKNFNKKRHKKMIPLAEYKTKSRLSKNTPVTTVVARCEKKLAHLKQQILGN